MAITLLAGTTVGSMVSSQATTALNGLTGGLSSGLMGFFNSSISGTIGAVLSNGFNLSCWGASMTPAKAKEETPKDIEHMLKDSGLDKSITLSNLNKFLKHLAFYRAAKNRSANNGSNSSCTRDGNRIQAQTANDFIQKTVDEIKKSYILSSPSMIKMSGWRLIMWQGADYRYNEEINVLQYSSLTPISQSGTTISSNSGTNSSSNNSNSNSNLQDVDGNDNDNSGGGSLLKTLGIGILGSIIASKL